MKGKKSQPCMQRPSGRAEVTEANWPNVSDCNLKVNTAASNRTHGSLPALTRCDVQADRIGGALLCPPRGHAHLPHAFGAGRRWRSTIKKVCTLEHPVCWLRFVEACLRAVCGSGGVSMWRQRSVWWGGGGGAVILSLIAQRLSLCSQLPLDSFGLLFHHNMHSITNQSILLHREHPTWPR